MPWVFEHIGKLTFPDNEDYFGYEQYPVKLNLEKLQTEINQSSIEIVSENEVLIQTKIKVPNTSSTLGEKQIDALMFGGNKLMDFLDTHPRTILDVSKLRHFINNSDIANPLNCDPIHVGKYNVILASVIEGCTSRYQGFEDGGSGKYIAYFPTSRYQIETLDNNKFDISILYDGRNSIVYEIINKQLM